VSARMRPLFDVFPALAAKIGWQALGEFPTPVESLAPALAKAGVSGDGWVKRDDLSSPIYGGNKVRTLEALFGEARDEDASIIYSTGAFGSNHAAATVLHARRAGLEPGAILFPQPPSDTAAENLRAIAHVKPLFRSLPHWSALPFGMASVRRAHERRNERAFVMVPGGATPRGGLGYVSAAFELGAQVRAGELPRPDSVVIGVGSTCTSAGLLVGFHHATRLGFFADSGGRPRAPHLVSVRVTPWPVTAKFRIVSLAVRISELLAELAGDRSLEVSAPELRAALTVDGRFLGRGYGYPTRGGVGAIDAFRAIDGFELDTTYSAKAAAGFFARLRERPGETALFWSTKSTAPLACATDDEIDERRLKRWLAKPRVGA
jgi:D-cysteine desulfhydrase